MNAPLSLRSIFWLWAPLAASWALMTVEYPIIQYAIARLPDVEVMLAAAGLVIVLEITIESPVIMLLATTTALARSPAAYRTLRRFTIHLNVAVTVVAALVAFVPFVFDALILDLLGIPPHIAAEARPAMQIMTFWSALIGWRRFQQGILIRHGRTRAVGVGTTLRLLFAAGTAVGLAHLGTLSGVVVGAWAWMAGVAAEAVYAHVAARPTVRQKFLDPAIPDGVPVTYERVAKFHAPLAATSLLSLLVAPAVQAGLSRMPFPEPNLAAWPVLFAILLFFRSPGFALPEAIIALLDRKDRVPPLRRFTVLLALASTLGIVVFLTSPLFELYVRGFVKVPDAVYAFVMPGLVAGAVIPLLQSLQSWCRGVLMATDRTKWIYAGMGIALATTAATIGVGVLLQWPGTLCCTAAITGGMVLETVFLDVHARRAVGRLPETPVAEA